MLVLANQSTAARRRVYFDLRDATDGITPETGEAGGQPQISTNGGAWTDTGIGTLTAIGNGRYYADLTQSAVASAGTRIETRYKSAATAETPGDSVRVVAFDPDDATRLGLAALPNAAADAAGGLPVSDAGGFDVDAILTRLTSARAGYLDNLNVGGNVASQADVQGVTQAQRVRVAVPQQMERPDSGSTSYRIWIYAYDAQHQAEDLDSNPTVTAENNAAVSRSGNLGTVTKPGATTGIYHVDYTVPSSHSIEGLVFKVSATEGGVTTDYASQSVVVDTTAVDFTAADRAKLDTLHDTRIPDVLSLANILAQASAALDAAIPGSPTAGSVNERLKALDDDWGDGGRLDSILDSVLADTGTDGVALSPATLDAIAAALLDLANGVESGITVRQAQRLILAAAAGKLSGAATANVLIRDTSDTKNRINATVDANGNRTAVTLDAS